MGEATSQSGKFSKTALLVGVFFLVEFLYILKLCLVFRPHIEGGLIPLGADIIVNGKAIYKDFFTIVWPGSFLQLAAAYALFGSSWVVSRVVLAVTIFGTGLLSYFTLRRHFSHWSSLLPAALVGFIALPTWNINYYHWDGLFWMVAFVFCLDRLIAAEHKSNLWAVASGITAGFAISCYQPLIPVAGAGIAVEAALSFLSLRSLKHSLKLLLLMSVPFVLLIGANFVYAVMTGGLDSFIAFTLIFPMHDYSGINKVSYGGNNLLSNLKAPESELGQAIFWIFASLCWWPWLLMLLTPPIVFIGGVYAIIKKRPILTLISAHESMVIWLVVGTLSWGVALHRPEIQRLFWGSFILMMLAFYLIGRINRQKKIVNFSLKAFYAITACGIAFYASGMVALLMQPKVILHSRRGDIEALKELEIVQALQDVTKPSEKVLVYPYDTTLYYLTQTWYPSIHPWLQYRYNSTADLQGSIDDMEKNRVKWVVWDTEYGNDTFNKLGWEGYVPLPKEDLIVDNYLEKNFKLLKQYGKYRLMERK